MPETAIGAYTVHAYYVHVQQYVKLAKQLGLAHMHIVDSFWWYKFDAANHVKCHIVCMRCTSMYACIQVCKHLHVHFVFRFFYRCGWVLLSTTS